MMKNHVDKSRNIDINDDDDDDDDDAELERIIC